MMKGRLADERLTDKLVPKPGVVRHTDPSLPDVLPTYIRILIFILSLKGLSHEIDFKNVDEN